MLGSGGEAAVDQAVAAIGGKDAAMRAAAISHASKLKGKDVGKRLAAELGKLPADHQALLIGALGDLGDAAVLPAITKCAASDNASVRLAAIRTIGKLGDAGSAKLLCDIAAGAKDAAEQQAAVNSLHGLKGDKVNATIVASMKQLGSDRRLDLAGLHPFVEKVFRLTRMDTVFNLYPTLDDALTPSAE